MGLRMSSITMRLREGTTGAVAERDAEFAWFFRTEYEAVVRTMYLIVHDREQARDIAQDAFVQLFTRWRRISQYERPEAWVRRVGIRMAVRAVRRERLRPRVERELDVASLPKPVDVDVLQAVRRLPAAQRAAVVLFYFEDRPVSEVAQILSCPEVTAKVYLHRARKRLATLLGEKETEEIDDGS
jgi:RNA polymerase sigma-70 factor (ECF subfamily)